MRNSNPSLCDAFLDYFDVAVAASAKQRDLVAQLRHRVYCDEFGHEPLAPDRRERDSFDHHSVAILLRHRRSGLPAGCVRLICASEEHRLALEDHCFTSMQVGYAETLAEDRDNICEFSRLAVDRAFRKRAGESHTQLGEYTALDCTHQERRHFSMIGIASFLAAFAAAEVLERRNVYAMMEATLPRLLHRSGIPVRQAGDFMDYHGRRAPYFITTDEAVTHMQPDLQELYHGLRGRLEHDVQTLTLMAPPVAMSVA